MVAPVPAERDLAALVTVGIKHTSAFPRRRAMLGVLLASIRARYGDSLRILVADDGRSAHKPTLQRHGARRIVLPRDSGLSHGRNELVRAARTPYITLLDDDVVFHAATDLEALVDALERSSAGVAGGCYADVRDVHGAPDCYNLRFDATDGGAVVHARTLPAPARGGGACVPAHATHNVFVGRTASLRRFGWDPRQKVMEHETFFYQLYLAGVGVLACPRVTVLHNTTRDAEYRERSFRLKEAEFMQYLCKNFPALREFNTPYLRWRCAEREYCNPVWGAQFAFDGVECHPMTWDAADDASFAAVPLVAAPIHSAELFPPADADGGGAGSAVAAGARRHVPLLVLIFTERSNTARRAWQRATWLSFEWHRAHLSREPVPWRYVYVQARRAGPPRRRLRKRRAGKRHGNGGGGAAAAAAMGELQERLAALDDEYVDRVVGDTVTLSAVREGYHGLVHKVFAALRWALDHTSFETILKTDDDSMVHVGRLWQWLHADLGTRGVPAHRPDAVRVYAGRIFPRSQVIRANFTKADLWSPAWFPADFVKWSVSFDAYAGEAYPPYAGGGGYVLGREVVEKVVAGYDARPRGLVFPVEDAFVGVLAKAAGYAPTQMDTFQEPPRGSLQTRETFIDQTLVHRVVEPQKAFRWLMLSDTCYGSPPVCRAMRNLTHGLPVELPPWWKTAPEAARRIVYEATERLRGGQTAAAPAAGGGGGSHSWLTDAVPDHHPRAFTGVQAEQCC